MALGVKASEQSLVSMRFESGSVLMSRHGGSMLDRERWMLRPRCATNTRTSSLMLIQIGPMEEGTRESGRCSTIK